MIRIKNYTRKILITLIAFVNFSAYTFGQNYSVEDLLNTGPECTYNQPTLPSDPWNIANRITSTANDRSNGNILDGIPARTEWSKGYGLYPIWFGGDKYIFHSPIASGGQIMLQWNDIEKTKGVYDFSLMDKMLKAFYDRKLYTTIQINGNNKPDYMYLETPYLNNIQLSVQVNDNHTLMYWYPSFINNYTNLLKAFGQYLASSQYLQCVVGIRLNFNAIGTEMTNVQSSFATINPRLASAYTYPVKADTTFKTTWSSTEETKYETAVLTAYMTNIAPYAKVYVRNSISNDLTSLISADLDAGKVGLFHTSSEPEPRAVLGEDKMTLLNNYSKNRKTLNYTEEWGDCWGIHGTIEDPHFCSPQQWNYWRILADLNVGISTMGMYGSIWEYVFGNPAPKNTQFTDPNPMIRREEIKRGMEFAFKYLGQHNLPAQSPGAFIAFRQSTENLSITNNPTFYGNTSTALNTFTNDYTFLSVRKPDNSVGVKLIGSVDQRFGAFARKLPVGEQMNIVLHPEFVKAIYTKPLVLRVVFFDDGTNQWNVKYGNKTYSVQNTNSQCWRVVEWNVIGTNRVNPLTATAILEKGIAASSTELNTLNSDICLTSVSGDVIFHMIELDRSTLFPNMYSSESFSTSLISVNNSQVSIQKLSSGISLNGLNEKMSIELFDFMGRKILSRNAQSDNLFLEIKNKGFYVLRLGAETYSFNF